MDDTQEMMIVLSIYLDEHIILPRRIMTLHNLRNLPQRISNLIKLGRILQIKTYISTCFVSDTFRIQNKLRSLDDPQRGQLLNTLMNGCSRNLACTGYFQERNASIIRYHS